MSASVKVSCLFIMLSLKEYLYSRVSLANNTNDLCSTTSAVINFIFNFPCVTLAQFACAMVIDLKIDSWPH
jgi:hypothetical protein